MIARRPAQAYVVGAGEAGVDAPSGPPPELGVSARVPSPTRTSQHDISVREPRRHQAAARRLVAATRAATPTERHCLDRQYSGSCQAQCPRQVQCVTRRNASAAVLASRDLGGIRPVRARMRSSPPPPGSTWLAAASSARRSSSSRPSSGAVTPPARQPSVSSTLLLQHGPQRGHAARRMALHSALADPHRRRYLGLRQVGVVA